MELVRPRRLTSNTSCTKLTVLVTAAARYEADFCGSTNRDHGGRTFRIGWNLDWAAYVRELTCSDMLT